MQDICPAEKDLPDILSGGRFLLPHKISGDKMYMLPIYATCHVVCRYVF
jgi:hypothetical protein